MILLKNKSQIQVMREAGRITAEALTIAGEAVREGITTKHLDTLIRDHIEKRGARPTFLGYGGFPASACISINREVIHGIPSADRVLQEGDIVKIDVGACWHGFNGDSANTFAVGIISDDAQKLIDAAKRCFELGFAQVKENSRIGDIGFAVESHATSCGFSVIRKYVGHGVGAELHEPPDVPNYGKQGHGIRLGIGMTIAIEPMLSAGTSDVYELDNRWTVVTSDGSLSSHYEHTVALTENGAELMTVL